MSRRGCLLLVLVASTQVAHGQGTVQHPDSTPVVEPEGAQQVTDTVVVPTVVIPHSTPVSVPTVSIPSPTPTPTATPRPTPTPRATPRPHSPGAHRAPARVARTAQEWIWAYLTSYCPGSAGWLSSSGVPVFYGMLANSFYRFGTRVYIPVIRMTGVVEDRPASAMWNHFDVWSPVCYSTPTGWFKVAIQLR